MGKKDKTHKEKNASASKCYEHHNSYVTIKQKANICNFQVILRSNAHIETVLYEMHIDTSAKGDSPMERIWTAH